MRNNIDHHAPPKFPAWGWALLVLMVVISWLPLALIVRSRAVKTTRQPIHLFLDMDFQPRYGPQDSAPMTDGRAMRLPVAGTVPFDALDAEVDPDDDHFYRGYAADGNLNAVLVDVDLGGNTVKEPKYYDGFPSSLEINRDLIERGRERYNIYCGVCHGRSGYGDGPVYQRISERQNMDATAVVGFPEPRNLHLPQMLDMPTGKLYDRITRGVFSVTPEGKKTYTMWPYAAQLSPRDRWAVVAYIRVMQRSQYYPADNLPEALKAAVEDAPQVLHPAVKPKTKAPFTESELNDPALIAQGEKLFGDPQLNCFSCHQVKEDVPAVLGIAFNAPKYMGNFWGAEQEAHDGFQDGVLGPLVKVAMDADYFYESVKEPFAKIRKGSQPGMTLGRQPTDEEIKALAAYVKSLSQ